MPESNEPTFQPGVGKHGEVCVPHPEGYSRPALCPPGCLPSKEGVRHRHDCPKVVAWRAALTPENPTPVRESKDAMVVICEALTELEVDPNSAEARDIRKAITQAAHRSPVDSKIYKRGSSLTWGEFLGMPNGTVVWHTYQQPGRRFFKLNYAGRIERREHKNHPPWGPFWRVEGDEESTAFSGHYERYGTDTASVVSQSRKGHGESHLWHAIEVGGPATEAEADVDDVGWQSGPLPIDVPAILYHPASETGSVTLDFHPGIGDLWSRPEVGALYRGHGWTLVAGHPLPLTGDRWKPAPKGSLEMCPGTGQPTSQNCVVCGRGAGLHRDDEGRLAADWHPVADRPPEEG